MYDVVKWAALVMIVLATCGQLRETYDGLKQKKFLLSLKEGWAVIAIAVVLWASIFREV